MKPTLAVIDIGSNSVRLMLAASENGRVRSIRKAANQTAYYKSLFDKEDRQSQGQLEYSQSKQGFLEQVLKLQKKHNDIKQIDIEKWL